MKSEYHLIQYVPSGGKWVEWWGYGAELHRLDGPAYILYDPLGNTALENYYILDNFISKEDFETPGFIDAFILEHS